ALRASVGQIFQNGESLANNLLRFYPFDVDHKTNAAGIVLKSGVVESLFGGRPVKFFLHLELPSEIASQVLWEIVWYQSRIYGMIELKFSHSANSTLK
ncbi:MAG: hypothetical protein B6I38_04410, partial [Anaerolineaceae bacterium 4572_5.1]